MDASKSTTSSLLQIGITVTNPKPVTNDEKQSNESPRTLRAVGWAVVLIGLVLAGPAGANYLSSTSRDGAVHKYETKVASYASCLQDLEILRAGGTVRHEVLPGMYVTENQEFISIDSDLGMHIKYRVDGQHGCPVPTRPWLDYFEWYYAAAAIPLGAILVGYADIRRRKQ